MTVEVTIPGFGTHISTFYDDDIVDPYTEAANAEANAVNLLITEAQTKADTAADAAIDQIDALNNYVAPTLPEVGYEAPTWNDPALIGGAVDPLVTADAPASEDHVTLNPITLEEVEGQTGAVSAPTTILPIIPDAPPLGPTGSAPSAPAGTNININPVPGITTPSLTIGVAVSPSLEEVVFSLPEAIVLEELSYTIDYSTINEAIERLSSIVITGDDIPDYTLILEEVFTAVGGMISGDGVNSDRVIKDSELPRKVSTSLQKRGLVLPDSVIGYDSWLSAVLNDYIVDSATLFDGMHADDVLRDAYTLATQAAKVLADIDLGIYDARFNYNIASIKGSLEIAKGVAAAYNAQVVKLEGDAAEYNAILAQVKANAQTALAEVKVAKTTGNTNKIIAQNFAIGEKTKSTEANVFAAKVGADKALLVAYRAYIDSLNGGVAEARLNMLDYTAYVVGYEGQLAQLKSVYNEYSANASATQEKNSFQVAAMRGETSKLKAIAAETRSLATAAAVEAMRKVRVSELNSASYLEINEQNAKSRQDIAAKVGEYAIDAGAVRTTAEIDSILPASQGRIGAAVSRFTQTALSSAGRAAQMAQSANDQLAKAYASAYEISGRAGAAVAAGRLSGYKVGAASTAAGTLSGSTSATDNLSGSGSTKYSESDNVTESI